MHATIYGRGQMVIPAQARQEARINQGDIVSVEAVGDGKIVMVRLNSPKKHSGAKVTFTRRKGRHMVGSVKRKPISVSKLTDNTPIVMGGAHSAGDMAPSRQQRVRFARRDDERGDHRERRAERASRECRCMSHEGIILSG